MKSLSEGLPPEIAARIHPDWRKNEADYWAVREQLVEQYRDQWIAFADGRVVVCGPSAVHVLHGAHELVEHPFLTCVGREFEPTRIRRAAFPYDSGYSPEPLPVMPVEFRTLQGMSGLVLDRVIPDTGADASVVSWADGHALGLDPSHATPGSLAGVGGAALPSLEFQVWVYLDGREHPCRLEVALSGNERILGRDVLNQVDVLFRGPSREVVVNP